jgi:hypothetical protein
MMDEPDDYEVFLETWEPSGQNLTLKSCRPSGDAVGPNIRSRAGDWRQFSTLLRHSAPVVIDKLRHIGDGE